MKWWNWLAIVSGFALLPVVWWTHAGADRRLLNYLVLCLFMIGGFCTSNPAQKR